MKAGQLDQRVTVERFTSTQDELGQPIEAWAPLFTCWAAVEPLTGREYGSATALHGIAEETADNDKALTVLYVGDWDPSGMQMSEIDIPDRLQRYGGAASIKRVALDRRDVQPGTDLPFFEATDKSKDPRYQWFRENYGAKCWELDALSPVVLRERVEAQILALLDRDAWNHAIAIEKAENLATLSWVTIVAMLEKLGLENITPNAVLTHAKAATKLQTTLKDASAGSVYLMDGGRVAGLPAYVTNQLDAKTGTPNTGRVIAGDFSQIVTGEWGVTEILANPYATGYYEKGDVQLRIMHTMDAVVRHPKAFVVADDMTI